MRAVAEGLFAGSSAEDMRLLGGRCTACAVLRFPAASACEQCGSAELTVEELVPVGELWTWTTQEFRPPSPPYVGDDVDNFQPFLLGYIELQGEVRVESRLVGVDARTARIGAEMRLVPLVVRTDADGEPVVTFAFEPVSAGSGGAR
jgi:uncharacterized OB-fold protein